MRQIPRRLFLLGATALCAARSLQALAQPPQLAKVGFLFTPSRATSQVPDLFSSAMRDTSSSRWMFTVAGASMPIRAPRRSLESTTMRMPPSMMIASPWRRFRISTSLAFPGFLP